jgi:hypothetical protein
VSCADADAASRHTESAAVAIWLTSTRRISNCTDFFPGEMRMSESTNGWSTEEIERSSRDATMPLPDVQLAAYRESLARKAAGTRIAGAGDHDLTRARATPRGPSCWVR